MSWISQRIDRLRMIVAELLHEDITPKHTLFGTRVLQIACGKYGLTEHTARQYIKTLGYSWERYRWIPYIKNNPYLSKEEQEEWIKKLSKQQ